MSELLCEKLSERGQLSPPASRQGVPFVSHFAKGYCREPILQPGRRHLSHAWPIFPPTSSEMSSLLYPQPAPSSTPSTSLLTKSLARLSLAPSALHHHHHPSSSSSISSNRPTAAAAAERAERSNNVGPSGSSADTEARILQLQAKCAAFVTKVDGWVGEKRKGMGERRGRFARDCEGMKGMWCGVGGDAAMRRGVCIVWISCRAWSSPTSPPPKILK